MGSDHRLCDAHVKPRRIEHLKAWRAAEKQRQRQAAKDEINGRDDWDDTRKKAEKRTRSEKRNQSFESGPFSGGESLKSERLTQVVAALFCEVARRAG